MRQKIIAGNWKMNKTIYQSIEFIQDLKAQKFSNNKKVIVCPPYTSLYVSSQLIEDTDIKLAAQNMHYEDQGAYTGEISPLMLLGSNVEYVIIGHSERRQYFNDTDEIVNKKVITALRHGLKPIVCVGESLEQRDSGKTYEVILTQVTNALKDVTEENILRVVIAYEPIWAIGTGETALAEDANEVCEHIRIIISKLYNDDISQKFHILYGGSINTKNAKQLFEMEHIDGGLVGGASLKVKDFIRIINFEE